MTKVDFSTGITGDGGVKVATAKQHPGGTRHNIYKASGEYVMTVRADSPEAALAAAQHHFPGEELTTQAAPVHRRKYAKRGESPRINLFRKDGDSYVYHATVCASGPAEALAAGKKLYPDIELVTADQM